MLKVSLELPENFRSFILSSTSDFIAGRDAKCVTTLRERLVADIWGKEQNERKLNRTEILGGSEIF